METKKLYEVLAEVEGQILPDEDSPFWDWFYAQVETQQMIHDLSIKLTGETAWDYYRRKANEKSELGEKDE